MEKSSDHDDDDAERDKRPEGPIGERGETPAGRLEALVDAVLGLTSPKLHELQAIIALGEEQKLVPGAMAYLKQVIFDTTGVAMSVLNQVHRDCRNTDADHGVLHCVALLAESALARLKEAYSALVFSEGNIWLYAEDGEGDRSKTGFYERFDMRDLDRFLLQEYGKLPSLESKSRRAEVSRRITSMLHDPKFFDDAPNGMNLVNGFVTYDAAERGVKLLPASPEHRSRSRLPVKYDPEAKAPVFMAGLARTFSDPAAIEAFREFGGCMLLAATPGLDDARHAMLLVGPRKGGKSSLLEVFRLLVPDYAISAVSPTAWGRDYDKAMLSGKTLNLVTELGGNKLVSGSDAKSIISFEVVKARLPYQEPFFFRPTAWHIAATNTVPKTDDEDPAFERRFLALRLDRTLQPDEVDPLYLAKVKCELAGVIAWFVEGAVRAMRRGCFELPQGHAEIIAEMQYGDDLYARFAITMLQKATDTESGVSTKAINAALTRFAQREGRATDGFTPTTGARRIASLARTLYGAKPYQLAGVPHYRGLRLAPGA